MTLKFELTLPRWTKWALGLGVPTLALSILTAVALGQWTKPNDFAPGQVIRAADMNTNFDTVFSALNDLDSRAAVPGTLMWWFCPHAGGCSATDVPAGWVVADGDTVTGQPTSPLNGVTLPNLIDSVVMGASFADIGSTGGENTSTIAVDHPVATTSTDGEHSHALPMKSINNGTEIWLYDMPFGQRNNVIPNGSVRHRYRQLTGDGSVANSTNDEGSLTTTDGAHSHTIDLPNLNVPHDNRPAYVGLLPLIKL